MQFCSSWVKVLYFSCFPIQEKLGLYLEVIHCLWRVRSKQGEIIVFRANLIQNHDSPQAPNSQFRDKAPIYKVCHLLLLCRNHTTPADCISPPATCMGTWHQLVAERNTQCQQEWEHGPLLFHSLYTEGEPVAPNSLPSFQPKDRGHVTSTASASCWHEDHLSQAVPSMRWK